MLFGFRYNQYKKKILFRLLHSWSSNCLLPEGIAAHYRIWIPTIVFDTWFVWITFILWKKNRVVLFSQFSGFTPSKHRGTLKTAMVYGTSFGFRHRFLVKLYKILFHLRQLKRITAFYFSWEHDFILKVHLNKFSKINAV